MVEQPVHIKARTVTIDEENVGRRLDNYLVTEIKNVAKSYVYRIIRSGEVRVNGGRRKAHSRLELNDRVRIPPFRESTLKAPVISESWRDSIKNSVLYEDELLLVVDKPAGLSVHAGSGKSYGLIDIAKQEFGGEVELAHRLDKDTSGCLLLGKSASLTRELHELFRAGEVNKRYRTLLMGSLKDANTLVTARLATQRKDVGEAKTRVDPSGKEARSNIVRLEVIKAGEKTSSYCDVFIDTGRTHQIRVHAAHLNHPVAGDPRYGDLTFNREMADLGLGRPYLHAAQLSFTNPRNGQTISIESKEPSQLRSVRTKLMALREVNR